MDHISTEAIKRMADGEIELLTEMRRNAFEQFSNSFRWITASLLAINGGAAIAILNAESLTPNWKIVSGSFLIMGVLAALSIAIFSQRANLKMIKPLQQHIGYWISVIENQERDVSLESALATEFRPAERMTRVGQGMGWFSVLLFLLGLSAVAVGLQASEQSGKEKQATAIDPNRSNRSGGTN